ncbi:hypothetical protein [Rhodoferax sp. U11-2br]|uniref:hypothetical protein n=1 Tax=Rhodoferax sp. U11-2br TaxID=2838878 RepID=UPI001BECB80D|nr:hypothetical protein [Rhodoferax sp. U11-2br]MBT3068360.1 hypothetical protein [Rhodoferax sp. U11-2br]
MLAPDWNHLRIGPYLRRERDKREYHRLFQFPHYVHGFRRLWLLVRLPKRLAPRIEDAPIDLNQRQLVVFENRVSENFEHHFHEVAGRAPELLDALRRMTRPRYLPRGEARGHVAIHVRLGDFSVPQAEIVLREGLRNVRLPIQWYVETLAALRKSLGIEIPALVYSDGEDTALAALLTQPGVRRAARGTAVTDLLEMVEATAMISSGSGFSIWACFLGRVPRLCFPSQRQLRVLGEPSDVDLEPELDFGASVSEGFAAAITRRLL